MKSAFRILTVSTMMVAAAGLVSAAPIIAYSNPTSTGNQLYSGSLGMDFNVLSAIDIYSLGVFDSGQNGFSHAMTVQIYSRTSTSSPIVSLSISAGTTGTLIGGDRFVALDVPLFLAPGMYSIVASGFTGSDPDGNTLAAGHDYGTLNDGGGLIAFTGTSRYGTAGLYPTSPDFSKAQYGAGTFTYTAAQPVQTEAVPEPGSMLLMGGGLALIGCFSRRFMR